MRARRQGLQGLRSPAEPTTPPWRGATVSAEDEPLLLTLQSAVKALLQTAQHLSMLTENASEVEVFCNTLEPVLLHKFKSRQFGIFTVHPWALVEHSEHRGDAEAEAVRLARAVGRGTCYTSLVGPPRDVRASSYLVAFRGVGIAAK